MTETKVAENRIQIKLQYYFVFKWVAISHVLVWERTLSSKVQVSKRCKQASSAKQFEHCCKKVWREESNATFILQ
jgi:hypothetical protein